MSTKERILNTLDLMGDNELEELFSLIQFSFVVKRKSWDDIKEDDPTNDELEAIASYHAVNKL